MSYTLIYNPANKANYGDKRSTSDIKYIVIHFTANDGDHDESNANYFKNNIVNASAHYFVDDDSVTRSVPDDYIAYSVGGKKYSNCDTTGGGSYYGKCTNKNSISIELCDVNKDGKIYPSAKTIENAIELTKGLMRLYNVPQSNVIRHFDVNGKPCPLYWCATKVKNNLWKSAFYDKLKNASYKVKVTATELNVRKGPGTSYSVVKVLKKDKVCTIITEANGWGLLKSGDGYIKLSYTEKV